MDAQLKKGVLEMCVLHAIRDKAMYGYDVMRLMRRYFPEVNESTFYAILRRLRADGNAEVTLSDNANGPTRKYYRITEAGRSLLCRSTAEWAHISNTVKDLGIGN